METKVILFASLYVLMSMFLFIYLFTSNILALIVSGGFGIIMVVSQYYLNPDAVNRFRENYKMMWEKIKSLAMNIY